MALLKEVELNGRIYDINYFTGSVVDEKKWSETEVSGSGSGSSGYSVGGTGYTAPGYMDVKSKTKRFDQLILKNKEGKEQSFQFQDWGIACHQGNVLSVLWAIPKGKDKGNYILVYNHQSEEFFMDDEMAIMFSPGRITLPLFGWNISWWPLAAIPAAPFLWYLLCLLLIPDGGFFFVLLFLASPFIGFWLTRKIARKIGQKTADEYIRNDRDGLIRAMKESKKDAE